MIWHKHADLIVEHNKIRQAYRGSCNATYRLAQSNKSTSDEDEEDAMEQDGSDADEEIVGARTPTTETKCLPERQLRANTQKNYTQEKDGDESSADNPFDIAAMANLSYIRKGKQEYEENDSDEEADEFAGLPKTNL
jgi:hypothetical protein